MNIEDNTFYAEQIFDDLAFRQKKVRSSNFELCKFIGCDLSESEFTECKFVDCEFKESNLNVVKFDGTRILETDFNNCKITGVNWTSLSWTSVALCSPVSFHSCDISFSVFHALKLPELIVNSCKAHDVDFSDCDLAGADFYATDLKDSRFIFSDLDRCNFREAVNYTINPMENSVEGANFSTPDVLSLLSPFKIKIDEHE